MVTSSEIDFKNSGRQLSWNIFYEKANGEYNFRRNYFGMSLDVPTFDVCVFTTNFELE